MGMWENLMGYGDSNTGNTGFDAYANQMQSNHGYMPTMNEYQGTLSDGTLGDAMSNAGTNTGGLFDQMNLGNWGTAAGGLGSLATGLYSIYQGNKMMDMYEHQMAQSDEKWGLQKEELARLKGVRSKNETKMAGMRADPNSMYYEG